MSISTFSYSQGGNKFVDLLNFINNQVVTDSVNPNITGSLNITGSTSLTGATNIAGVITGSATGSFSLTGSLIQFSQITIPTITAALPTATSATGSLIVSGSGTAVKLYFFNGVAWMTASMSTI